jgi:hypothetical protein
MQDKTFVEALIDCDGGGLARSVRRRSIDRQPAWLALKSTATSINVRVPAPTRPRVTSTAHLAYRYRPSSDGLQPLLTRLLP